MTDGIQLAAVPKIDFVKNMHQEDQVLSYNFPDYVLVRTHNNVLIIDLKVKAALEIAEVQFADKQAEKRRWYESMVAV